MSWNKEIDRPGLCTGNQFLLGTTDFSLPIPSHFLLFSPLSCYSPGSFGVSGEVKKGCLSHMADPAMADAWLDLIEIGMNFGPRRHESLSLKKIFPYPWFGYEQMDQLSSPVL